MPKKRMNEPSQLQRVWKQMQKAGQGVFDMYIIRREQGPAIALGALLGQPNMQKWLSLLAATLQRIHDQPGVAACVFCEREFTDTAEPEVFVFALPAIDEPEDALSWALCYGCAQTDFEPRLAGLINGRDIGIHEPGHA